MMFGRRGRQRFLEAVAGFDAAVRERDEDRTRRAYREMHRRFEGAGRHEIVQATPRLAALLPELPAGPDTMVAIVIGACVERGADPAGCAPAIFHGLDWALDATGEFCARWSATGGGDFPEPDHGDPAPAVVERVGMEAALGWWLLPRWETAAVALLNHAAVRTGLDAAWRARVLRALRTVEEASGHAFTCLVYALLVLDDEPLVVLHRPSGTGYAMRMSGIGDNFQLHTLLADVLVGGGHVPGRAPSAPEAAVCRDAPGQVPTTGAFNLVAPGGEWVWNEGTPGDIPVVDGVRLLVLDPPPYERSWPAGRFLPGMAGDLLLERVLDADETRAWLGSCAPAR
ncbi:hypothetical protein [Streptomyces caniscabiei]|uniref:Uncharacterized protein n=1 Tax=Streptomyces caniscabiei TaxID=2746961 RepID=A0ABU4MZL1_9ACTN|nr:hypothetical protein [Streptomyces caniscabiei]MBE4739668.1 hypothetical protein [Streptomyces caniscabiei]MBE4760278.1 hypothetical protein [Streptomyces caniscabiei]MBE4773655.1 hypothetical protein [Streptomyces caniscabiei]MBE4782652.1 hypothetical protein [Streptomyces caniscabiei]MBE4791955.1 hypothetical protein [Streptomyces caniscabiei]